MSNAVNPQQILLALAQRMAAARGQGSLSGIPGAAQGGMVPMQGQSQAQPQQGGIPGAAAPQPSAPQPQASSQSSSGPARQLSHVDPTPFNGTFGDRRGIISQLVNSAEKRGHDKKVNEASMYYNQINSFLASNDPADQAKAHQLLDDPKVRKILKTGLDYVPLEEDVPPEAIGVHQAQQKIDKKQNALNQIKQLLGGNRQQQKPVGRAAIPQPSVTAQQEYQLGEAKTEEQQALAQQHKATGEAETAKVGIEQQKADAEKIKAEAERVKDEAAAEQSKAAVERFKKQGDLYEQQAKDLEDTNPSRKRQLDSHSNEMNASADYYRMLARYGKDGKLPGAKIQDLMKAARADAITVLRGYISDNKDAAKAVSKDTGYIFGPKAGLVQQQDDAAKKADGLKRAIAWFDSEGTQAVNNGKMTPPQAAAQMYRMAGIEPPVPTEGSDSGSTPQRPKGVPDNATWDANTRTWSTP